MKRRAASWAAAVMLLTSCGGEQPGEVVEQTVANLGQIRSGDVSFGIVASTGDGAQSGFRIDGPFELAAGGLPRADVRYTRVTGSDELVTRLISTGDEVFVELDGDIYELPPEQTVGLVTPEEAETPLAELTLDSWIRDATVSSGKGGTTIVRGELDMVNALNDFLELAAGLGSQLRPMSQESQEELRAAVEQGTVELITGSEDHLLRELTVHATFKPDAPPVILEAFGGLAVVEIALELGFADINQPVSVEAPRGARPLSELGG